MSQREVQFSEKEIEAIEYYSNHNFALSKLEIDKVAFPNGNAPDYMETLFTDEREREECVVKLTTLGIL